MLPASLRKLARKFTYRPQIFVVRSNLYHRVTADQEPEGARQANLFADAGNVSAPIEDITQIPTVVELPAITDAFLLDRKPSFDLTETQRQFLALHGIELAPRPLAAPIQRVMPRETAVMALRIVSYADKKNRVSLDTLISRAIKKCVRANGALPTHVVVSALRLMSERKEAEWEVYQHAISGGVIAIVLQTNARCPWNTARAYIDTSARAKPVKESRHAS